METISFDEYLIRNSKDYKIKLTAMEIGFLHSLLDRYMKDEDNKTRCLDIATYINNNRLKPLINKIYKKSR